MASRFAGPGQPYEGLAESGRWTGVVRIIPEALDQPLRWRKPRRIFVNSMSDLFHEELALGDIVRVFVVMALARNHTFQVLTKRPERMWDFLDRPASWDRIMANVDAAGAETPAWPLPNVQLGVSVEDQETADARISILLQAPAAVRFVSYEPALGPVTFARHLGPQAMHFAADHKLARVVRGLDWIIAGGESGPGARPAHPDWFRAVRDQCAAMGVPFFFKQWGGLRPKSGGRLLDGLEHDGRPA